MHDSIEPSAAEKLDERLTALAHEAQRDGANSRAFAALLDLLMTRRFPRMALRVGARPSSSMYDDLYSAASEAVMGSIRDWDPASGKTYPSYVLKAMRNAVAKTNTESRTWETGHENKRHLTKLRMIRNDLKAANKDRTPEPAEVADTYCAQMTERFLATRPDATPEEIESHLRKNGYAKVRADLGWADRLDGVARFETPVGAEGLTLGDTIANPATGTNTDFTGFYAVAQSLAGDDDTFRIVEMWASMTSARERGDRDEADGLSEVLAGAGRVPSTATRKLREALAGPVAMFVCFDEELESRIDCVDAEPATAAVSVEELCRLGV